MKSFLSNMIRKFVNIEVTRRMWKKERKRMRNLWISSSPFQRLFDSKIGFDTAEKVKFKVGESHGCPCVIVTKCDVEDRKGNE